MRRLCALVEQLPVESNYVRLQLGGWTPEMHMLATLVELAHVQVRLLMRLNGQRSIPAALRISRPQIVGETDGARPQPARTLGDFRRMFAQWPPED